MSFGRWLTYFGCLQWTVNPRGETLASVTEGHLPDNGWKVKSWSVIGGTYI